MSEKFKTFFNANPKIGKITGVALIVLGVISLVTPFTPGSWLVFIGLELLGFDLIFWHKIKRWWRKRVG